MASPWRRALAAVIDGVLGAVVLPVPIVGALVAVAYSLVKDALPFLDGQSIGKQAMGIRVVKEDSLQGISGEYRTAIVRQISLMIPLFGAVDALMVLSASRKRFGDRWAKTIVIVDQ